MRTNILVPLIVSGLALILGGCATVVPAGGGEASAAGPVELVRTGAYTFEVPANALVGTSYFPTAGHQHELAPTAAHWGPHVVYPRSTEIRMPGARGSMVIFDPNTEGNTGGPHDLLLESSWLLKGCGWTTEVNGIPCVELRSYRPDGHHYRTVWVNRSCRGGADLVIHYDDAFLTEKTVYDDIIASLSR